MVARQDYCCDDDDVAVLQVVVRDEDRHDELQLDCAGQSDVSDAQEQVLVTSEHCCCTHLSERLASCVLEE